MTLRPIQRPALNVQAPNVLGLTDSAEIQPVPACAKAGRKMLLRDLRQQLEVLERRGLFDDGRAHGGATGPAVLPFDIAEIDVCLPGRGLALAAVHEITCGNGEGDPALPADLSSETASLFFSAYLAARRSRQLLHQGTVLWICRRLLPHAPGLASSGLPLDRTIFVRVADDEAALWAMEEALKCRSLSAVVAEVRRVGLTASRRLQLAAEAHGVTGLLLRPAYSSFATSAVHSRWRIRSAASGVWSGQGLGLSPELKARIATPHNPLNPPPRAMGPPCLQVELLRARGGGQGQWILQWNEMTNNEAYQEGAFHLAAPLAGGPLPARPSAAVAGRARVGGQIRR